MMHIIHCNNCDKSGLFKFTLKYEFTRSHCEKCNHMDRETWEYYFCNQDCMFQWLKDNEIEEKGLPCRRCIDWDTNIPTGWDGGIERNGICTHCNGIKRVKPVTMA